MLAPVFSSLFLAVSALAQATINSPPGSLNLCQPFSVSWTGGTAPYYVEVLDFASKASVLTLSPPDGIAASPITWMVNLPAGKEYYFKINDASGTINYSSQFSITGTNDGCLNSTESVTQGTAANTGASGTGAAANTDSAAPTGSDSAANTDSANSGSTTDGAGNVSPTSSGGAANTGSPAGTSSAPPGASSTPGGAGALKAAAIPALAAAGLAAFFSL